MTTHTSRAWSAKPSLDPPTDQENTTLQLGAYPDPGFQGSSSLVTILETIRLPHPESSDRTLHDDGFSDIGIHKDLEAGQHHVFHDGGTTMVEEGARILELFVDAMVDGSLQKMFDDWKDCGMESHLGAFLVAPFFDTITDFITRINLQTDRQAELLACSRHLFDIGREPIHAQKSTTLHDYANQHTGGNLRWEAIGIVLALAG